MDSSRPLSSLWPTAFHDQLLSIFIRFKIALLHTGWNSTANYNKKILEILLLLFEAFGGQFALFQLLPKSVFRHGPSWMHWNDSCCCWFQWQKAASIIYTNFIIIRHICFLLLSRVCLYVYYGFCQQLLYTIYWYNGYWRTMKGRLLSIVFHGYYDVRWEQWWPAR